MPTLTCARSPSVLSHRSQGHSTASRLAEVLRPEDGHARWPTARFALNACQMRCMLKDSQGSWCWSRPCPILGGCAFCCSAESVFRKSSSSFRCQVGLWVATQGLGFRRLLIADHTGHLVFLSTC